MLVRLARQAELGLGQKIEKESHGRKLLLVRHPLNGSVSVMDAHCFHMGTPLVGGDIEDVDGHACVVCPAHRYRIDINTGKKVEKDLCGKTCSSEDQKQRLYKVHCDDEFIWVDLPTQALDPLPSDYYNQVRMPQQQPIHKVEEQPRQNYGLLGRATDAPAAPPLQPYAGISGWPVVHQSTPVDEPQLMLSQQANASAPSPPSAAAPNMMSYFPSARPDPPHVARRKAATAAILNRAYKPPTADNTPMQSPEKPAAPAPQQSVAAAAAPVVRQATLFESWAKRPVAAAGSGAEGMDTD